MEKFDQVENNIDLSSGQELKQALKPILHIIACYFVSGVGQRALDLCIFFFGWNIFEIEIGREAERFRRKITGASGADDRSSGERSSDGFAGTSL